MNPMKRGLLLSVSLAATVLLAVACGGDSKTETKATTTSGGTSATTVAGATTGGRPADAAAEDKQTIRMTLVEPQYLDPHRSSFGQDITVERMLFRGLFQLDKDAKPVAALATELPSASNGGISADGKTYTIKLKPGLKYSDGSPLTARDFEYSFLRVLDPGLAADYSYLLFSIANGEKYGTSKATGAELEAVKASVGVKAVDDSTLRLTLDQADPLMLLKLSLWAAYPVKKDAVDKDKEKAFTDGGKLIGTGPYMLKEWKPKEQITLVPNPNFALEPKPVLKEVRLRLIDDDERAFDAYRNNELDVLWSSPVSKLDQIRSDSQLKAQYVQQKGPVTRGLEMNQKVEVLKNPKVRIALSKAMDRESLVKTVFQGAHVATQQWFPPGVGGVDVVKYDEQTFDVAGAKKALEEAGFANGQNFPKLKLLLRDAKEQRDLGEFLKTDFKKNLGIDIELEIVDGKTRSARFQKSDFELLWGGWGQDFPDPENWIDGLWNTGGGNNKYAFSNADLDALFKANKYEPNQEKRWAAYKQMHDIVNKTVGIANGYHESLNFLIKPNVSIAERSPLVDSRLPGDWSPERWYIKK